MQKPKLAKLIKLWGDKSIFSASTLSKMRSTEESWEAFKARMKEDYRAAIETALGPSQQTLDNYRYRVMLEVLVDLSISSYNSYRVTLVFA